LLKAIDAQMACSFDKEISMLLDPIYRQPEEKLE